MTRILAVLLAIGVAAILVVATNGLWLDGSSALVRNAGTGSR